MLLLFIQLFELRPTVSCFADAQKKTAPSAFGAALRKFHWELAAARSAIPPAAAVTTTPTAATVAAATTTAAAVASAAIPSAAAATTAGWTVFARPRFVHSKWTAFDALPVKFCNRILCVLLRAH